MKNLRNEIGRQKNLSTSIFWHKADDEIYIKVHFQIRNQVSDNIKEKVLDKLAGREFSLLSAVLNTASNKINYLRSRRPIIVSIRNL